MTPPGQKIRADFPRFGLPPYANRFPENTDTLAITIVINKAGLVEIEDAFAQLPRASLQADFHCVTTWTYPDAVWSGVKFVDFFDHYIKPRINKNTHLTGAVLCAQDGYKTSLLLEDCLNDSVLLADTLNDEPLTIEHGAPLRIVAPEHYGYKNLKHLKRIEFYTTLPTLKRGLRAFLDHPRARVRNEERGRWVPGWILRYLYRPMIGSTEKVFGDAMRSRNDSNDSR